MPTLLRLLLLLPFLAALFPPAQTQAQGVRLDSLWGKNIGVRAMTFTPDSKQLLITGGDRWIRIFNAQDGKIIDSLYPQEDCWQLQFSKDSTQLYASGMLGLQIFDSRTYKVVGSYLSNSDTYRIIHSTAISPNNKFFAVKLYVSDNNRNYTCQRMTVIDKEDMEVVWQKDIPVTRPDGLYPISDISFSADGNYILGQREYSYCRWNIHDTSQVEELLVDSLVKTSLIAYSPDNQYWVAQSNLIYSIAENRWINQDIIGFKKGNHNLYNRDAAFTASGNTVIVCDSFKLVFINLGTKTALKGFNFPSVTTFCLSPDSSMLASYNGKVRNDKIHWNVSSVKEESPMQEISIFPLPSKEQTTILINSIEDIPYSRITIIDARGITVQTLYEGAIASGNRSFALDNHSFASASYTLRLESDRSVVSKTFIISK